MQGEMLKITLRKDLMPAKIKYLYYNKDFFAFITQ